MSSSPVEKEQTKITNVIELKRKQPDINMLEAVEDDPVFHADPKNVLRMQRKVREEQAPQHPYKPGYVSKQAKKLAAEIKTSRAATRVGVLDADTGAFTPDGEMSEETRAKLRDYTTKQGMGMSPKSVATLLAFIGIPALICMFMMMTPEPVKASPQPAIARKAEVKQEPVSAPATVQLTKVEQARCNELEGALARKQISGINRSRSGACMTAVFADYAQMEAYQDKYEPRPEPPPAVVQEPEPVERAQVQQEEDDPCAEIGEVNRTRLYRDREDFEAYGFNLKSDVPLMKQAEKLDDAAVEYLGSEAAANILERRVCGLKSLRDRSAKAELARSKKHLKQLNE